MMIHIVWCDTHHESHVEEHGPKHIHTVHHHHIQKQTIYKKINVPVIKEVKVPYYVYEPFKVPYHYLVKPYIVKVPIEYHHEEKHEDVHHPEPTHEEHGDESMEGHGGDDHGDEHKE